MEIARIIVQVMSEMIPILGGISGLFALWISWHKALSVRPRVSVTILPNMIDKDGSRWVIGRIYNTGNVPVYISGHALKRKDDPLTYFNFSLPMRLGKLKPYGPPIETIEKLEDTGIEDWNGYYMIVEDSNGNTWKSKPISGFEVRDKDD